MPGESAIAGASARATRQRRSATANGRAMAGGRSQAGPGRRDSTPAPGRAQATAASRQGPEGPQGCPPPFALRVSGGPRSPARQARGARANAVEFVPVTGRAEGRRVEPPPTLRACGNVGGASTPRPLRHKLNGIGARARCPGCCRSLLPPPAGDATLAGCDSTTVPCVEGRPMTAPAGVAARTAQERSATAIGACGREPTAVHSRGTHDR